jgi:hypothetical protein
MPDLPESQGVGLAVGWRVDFAAMFQLAPGLYIWS